jgi:hypothetical protein
MWRLFRWLLRACFRPTVPVPLWLVVVLLTWWYFLLLEVRLMSPS